MSDIELEVVAVSTVGQDLSRSGRGATESVRGLRVSQGASKRLEKYRGISDWSFGGEDAEYGV